MSLLIFLCGLNEISKKHFQYMSKICEIFLETYLFTLTKIVSCCNKLRITKNCKNTLLLIVKIILFQRQKQDSLAMAAKAMINKFCNKADDQFALLCIKTYVWDGQHYFLFIFKIVADNFINSVYQKSAFSYINAFQFVQGANDLH